MQPIDPERFAHAQLLLDDGAAGVDERPTVALQPLHDEAFAAKEARADFAVEGNAQAHTLGDRKSVV